MTDNFLSAERDALVAFMQRSDANFAIGRLFGSVRVALAYASVGAGLLLAGTPAALADNIDLIKGKVLHENSGADLSGRHVLSTRQLLAVKNNTPARITVFIECAFFKKDELLDTGGPTIGNLEPGQMGYGEAMTAEGHADRVDCRLSSAWEVDATGLSTAAVPISTRWK